MTYQDLLVLLNEAYGGDEFLSFSSKIISTKEKFLGIRVPDIRKIAKIAVKENLDLESLPIGEIYEVDFVHAEAFFIIHKDEKERYAFIKSFLAKTDGGSICDEIAVLFKGRDPVSAIEKAKEFSQSKHTWVRRFAYVGLISLCKEIPAKEIIPLVEEDKEYYVNMGQGWLLASLAIYRFDEVYQCLRICPSPVIKKMTISKSLDSFRIGQNEKALLRQLR